MAIIAAHPLATTILATIPMTYIFGGDLLRMISKSVTDNVFGGAIEGTAAAAGGAASNVLKEAMNSAAANFNMDEFAEKLGKGLVTAAKNFGSGTQYQPGDIGKFLGETFTKEFQSLSTASGSHGFAESIGDGLTRAWNNFIKGTGYQQGDFGTKFGETLAKEMGNLFTSAGIDPTSGAGASSDMIQKIIKGFKLGKITETVGDEINDGFDSFWDTLNPADKGRHMGEAFRDFAKEATKEAGKGMRESVNNTAGEVLKGITFDILPYVVIGIMAVTAAPLTAYYLYYKAKHNIGRPKLATQIHQRTILTPLTERIGNAADWVTGGKTKPIYNSEISRRVKEISEATQNIRNNGGYFQNVLFYGPGGTGKTMVSETIAEESGMSYIKMSGGDLAQYIKRGEHVTELNKLMDKMNLSWRPWSTRPWIFFIDEAESLCRDRSKLPTAELLELQNAFLNRTGTQSKKFMVILSTNRMEDLDEAILSRMDHKIYIGPPAEAERVGILNAYIPQFFSSSERTQFFTKPQVDKIGKATNNMTGRALFKMLNAMAQKKASTADFKLTQSMIDQTITDTMSQEAEIAKRREKKETENRKAIKSNGIK